MSAALLALFRRLPSPSARCSNRGGRSRPRPQRRSPLPGRDHPQACLAVGRIAPGLRMGVQATALERGSLALVQSICALSLVFALPLGPRLTGQQVGRRSIVGALLFSLSSLILPFFIPCLLPAWPSLGWRCWPSPEPGRKKAAGE